VNGDHWTACIGFMCLTALLIAVGFFLYSAHMEHVAMCKELVPQLTDVALALSECAGVD
jgi:hypothetical protein